MDPGQGDPTKRKLLVTRTMIEQNPYLSQKNIAQTLSLHRDTVKILMMEELNLPRIKFKWIPRSLTASQKLERVKISRKIFGASKHFKSMISFVPSRGLKPESV
jgi:hypothetical protein